MMILRFEKPSITASPVRPCINQTVTPAQCCLHELVPLYNIINRASYWALYAQL